MQKKENWVNSISAKKRTGQTISQILEIVIE